MHVSIYIYIYIQVCPFEKAGSLEAGWPIYTCFFVYIIDIYIYIYISCDLRGFARGCTAASIDLVCMYIDVGV